MANNEIMVTIWCLVYNHEKYLRDCLDGFVMQHTNFKFEAIVHDDCSTDTSRQIIQEYAEKYPQIIIPVYEDENQYSKHDGSLGRVLMSNTRGKYIAECEGDDYWTDSHKLQKQVDFMESHPDYSLCFHHTKIIYESLKGEYQFPIINNRECKRVELYNQWIAHTSSNLYKKEVIESQIYQKAKKLKTILCADLVLTISASYFGKIFGMPDTMSVYRRNTGGIMNTFEDRQLELCRQFIDFDKVFKSDLHKSNKLAIGRCGVLGFSYMIHGKILKGLKIILLAMRHAPIETVHLFFTYHGLHLK